MPENFKNHGDSPKGEPTPNPYPDLLEAEIQDLEATPNPIHPRDLLTLIASVKELPTIGLEIDVKIGDKHWDEFAVFIESCRRDIISFVKYYGIAHTIDAQEIKKRVTLDVAYWEEIRGEAKEGMKIDRLWFWALANRIKPEGEEFLDITVTPGQLEKMIDQLKSYISFNEGNISYENNVFELIRALKNKEIKVKEAT